MLLLILLKSHILGPLNINVVRMNPVVDENKKEESWKMRRPALVVTV